MFILDPQRLKAILSWLFYPKDYHKIVWLWFANDKFSAATPVVLNVPLSSLAISNFNSTPFSNRGLIQRSSFAFRRKSICQAFHLVCQRFTCWIFLWPDIRSRCRLNTLEKVFATIFLSRSCWCICGESTCPLCEVVVYVFEKKETKFLMLTLTNP